MNNNIAKNSYIIIIKLKKKREVSKISLLKHIQKNLQIYFLIFLKSLTCVWIIYITLREFNVNKIKFHRYIYLSFCRYKSMAEFGSKDRSEGPKNLEPDWSYNIGEAVLDINAVTLSSFEVGILVLGEKNLYCLKDNCVSLKYAKRLEYKALCFQAYVIGIYNWQH